MPVEVLELLSVPPGALIVDATVGLAGHALLLLDKCGPGGALIGIDADENNLVAAAAVLAGRDNVRLFHENFANIEAVLRETGVNTADTILADLGISSNQLEDAQRGFSFALNGPLDMRIDSRLGTSAEDLINRLSETELSNLIYDNSQERFSRRIARAIHRARREGRIKTTAELSRIVCAALGRSPQSHKEKIHPATRTFMALRIAVNEETTRLQQFLDSLPRVLKPGGRAAVISFHSLEDGLCKKAFRGLKQRGLAQILTKRPITATKEERMSNPRSRSAKLRAIERI